MLLLYFRHLSHTDCNIQHDDVSGKICVCVAQETSSEAVSDMKVLFERNSHLYFSSGLFLTRSTSLLKIKI